MWIIKKIDMYMYGSMYMFVHVWMGGEMKNREKKKIIVNLL